jgi:hypothetical protein
MRMPGPGPSGLHHGRRRREQARRGRVAQRPSQSRSKPASVPRPSARRARRGARWRRPPGRGGRLPRLAVSTVPGRAAAGEPPVVRLGRPGDRRGPARAGGRPNRRGGVRAAGPVAGGAGLGRVGPAGGARSKASAAARVSPAAIASTPARTAAAGARRVSGRSRRARGTRARAHLVAGVGP